MIQISPYHPELDAIWHALAKMGARSIAVVAADAGEGTTLIATAIARRAGLSLLPEGQPSCNSHALLIDLDVTRPSVSRSLGLRPKVDEIVRLDAMGIAVLGNISAAATEDWRERARLARQLADWRATWSVVVIDTAPLLTGESHGMTGATAAAAADACVMVTLAGRTPANRICEARELLAGAGANLIGTIVNDRDNPSLKAEVDRDTYRFARFLPKTIGSLRARMNRSALQGASV